MALRERKRSALKFSSVQISNVKQRFCQRTGLSVIYHDQMDIIEEYRYGINNFFDENFHLT